MSQSLPILLVEIALLAVGIYAVWRTILEKWSEPITPELIDRGKKELLVPWYRRKQERSIWERIRRLMYAVEVGVKRIAKR